jgi:hypothetical protein
VQLYYGASSQFAFLQQIYRGVLSEEASFPSGSGAVQDVSPGLEMFLQKGFFFGLRPLMDATTKDQTSSLYIDLHHDLAVSFLDYYMIATHPILPCFQEQDLRALVHSLDGTSRLQPQSKAIILAVLALGATSTDKLALADQLFAQAKVEAAPLEEDVNLRAVQLSVLFGLFQLAMGRPNSTYLHLGVACRKAFAMGLHIEAYANGTASRPAGCTEQERRITIWCLYLHEWYVRPLDNLL